MKYNIKINLIIEDDTLTEITIPAQVDKIKNV